MQETQSYIFDKPISELYEQSRIQDRDEAHQEALGRLEEIGPDKVMITTICSELHEILANHLVFMNTEEANKLTIDMLTEVKERIRQYEEAGKRLH